ncbi:hypothetical protein [Myxococcus eversor]|uniref:aromatic-ring hydroxylase C-terminal domain-containing protein n=1 Tax=Myxococcus eversor TaxID=2709661 RepID=UPI003B8328FE
MARAVVAGGRGRGAPLRVEPRLACADRVRYVAHDAKERRGLSALLVRPDGFVAWASDTTPHPDEVIRVASRWFAARS